jgi:hypothetical protein
MRLKLFIAPLVIALTLFASLNASSAQEDTSISLGYAPVSQELYLEPGETYSDKVTVWNLSDSEIQYFIKVHGFKQIEEYPGTAVILSAEQDLISTTSASKWFELENEEVVVPSNYNFELHYTITVPENIAAGEYYAQIFFHTEQDEKAVGPVVTLNNLAGGPTFLIKTGDELTENVEVLEFQSAKKFYETPAITLNTSLENTGNVHLKPRGTIVLTNIFGQELATVEFNTPGRAIIRDTIATYVTEWESNYLFTDTGKLAVGPIKAELTLTYKSESPGYSPLTAETTFWILQWKAGLAILGTIIMIVWIVKTVRKPRKVDVPAAPAVPEEKTSEPVQTETKTDEETSS